MVLSGKKTVPKFELPETQFKRTKSPIKPTWSEKMTVLSTFLKSSLNFLSNNLKNTTKFGKKKKVRKAVSKFELTETQFERRVRIKIACKPLSSEKITVLSTFF